LRAKIERREIFEPVATPKRMAMRTASPFSTGSTPG